MTALRLAAAMPAIVDIILDCGGAAVSVRTECQLFKRYRHQAKK